jgi:hypothetical protein
MSEKIKKILEEVVLSLEKVTNKKAKIILKKIKKAKNKI